MFGLLFIKPSTYAHGFVHYSDVVMNAKASEITSLTIVYSILYSGADQRKPQNSASLAIVRGIHRRPVNSPHKWPVTRKIFPFDDVIMCTLLCCCSCFGYYISFLQFMWFVHPYPLGFASTALWQPFDYHSVYPWINHGGYGRNSSLHDHSQTQQIGTVW